VLRPLNAEGGGNSGKAEVLVPWNDHFVKKIDKVARVVTLDLSALRGVVL
jgi:hypothetical protein